MMDQAFIMYYDFRTGKSFHTGETTPSVAQWLAQAVKDKSDNHRPYCIVQVKRWK